jgi:hypothetical protein
MRYLCSHADAALLLQRCWRDIQQATARLLSNPLKALRLPCSDSCGLCLAGRLLQLAAGPAAGRHLRPHLPPVRP